MTWKIYNWLYFKELITLSIDVGNVECHVECIILNVVIQIWVQIRNQLPKKPINTDFAWKKLIISRKAVGVCHIKSAIFNF